MTGVEQTKQPILSGIIHVKLMRTDGIAFNSDAENLGFHRNFDLGAIVIHRQNLIQRRFQPLTR